MMASKYPPQIFWVFAVALAYTLLAFAEGEETKGKRETLHYSSRHRQDKTTLAGGAFKEGRHIPTMPCTGLAAVIMPLKTSTTALSRRILLCNTVRKF